MSAAVRTLDQHIASDVDAPFYHTFPVWVIEALAQRNIKAAAVESIKVMAKTAEVTVPFESGDAAIKVYRRDAFKGRTSE